MSLNVNSVRVAQALSELDLSRVPEARRGSVMTIAIARLLAYRIPLAESEQDPIVNFNQQHANSVMDVIGQINEHMAIHIEDTFELCRRLYAFRYRIAFDPTHPSVTGLIDALIRVGSPEIVGQTSTDLTQYADDIEHTTNVVRPLVVSFSAR